jgi:hypothetical protein
MGAPAHRSPFGLTALPPDPHDQLTKYVARSQGDRPDRVPSGRCAHLLRVRLVSLLLDEREGPDLGPSPNVSVQQVFYRPAHYCCPAAGAGNSLEPEAEEQRIGSRYRRAYRYPGIAESAGGIR